jgi:hypothetical protein
MSDLQRALLKAQKDGVFKELEEESLRMYKEGQIKTRPPKIRGLKDWEIRKANQARQAIERHRAQLDTVIRLSDLLYGSRPVRVTDVDTLYELGLIEGKFKFKLPANVANAIRYRLNKGGEFRAVLAKKLDTLAAHLDGKITELGGVTI